ncbi:MAG TPA: hypothetical protein VGQ83_13485 [Polyangia bacterium]|jgi:hypothetical protein
MGALGYSLRRALELACWPLDRLPAVAGLTLLSLWGGVALLFLVGRLTNQPRLGRARDRMSAALYELRLFWDAPGDLARAFGRFLAAAARYLAHLAPAMALLAAPFGLVYLHLDARYGTAPLPLGEPAIVRVALAPGVDGGPLQAEVDGRAVAVTAPPLVLAAEGAVYLRVEPRAAGRHRLGLRLGGVTVAKELAAGATAGPVHAARARGAAVLWAPGVEPPLPAGPIAAVEVLHPARPERYLGLPWWLYALLVSTAIAFALRRPAGVVL